MFASPEILVFCISLIVTVLITWFKTEAFPEYLSVLGFKKLFYIREYKDSQKTEFAVNYPTFLLCQKDCFLSRLISCPTCTSFWLAVFCSAVVGGLNLPVLFLSSLVTFYLFEYLVILRS
jgi:hypothetical protein